MKSGGKNQFRKKLPIREDLKSGANSRPAIFGGMLDASFEKTSFIFFIHVRNVSIRKFFNGHFIIRISAHFSTQLIYIL